MDLGLLQREVAERIGVSKDTYRFWECNATLPLPQQWPGLIRFLGGFPFPLGRSLPERLCAARLIQGLTHRALAEIFGVDPSNVSRWERGLQEPSGRLDPRVRDWIREALSPTGDADYG